MKNAIFAIAMLLSQFCVASEIRVHAGQSIQAAVDAAAPGDRIVVQPGVYHEVGRPCVVDPTVTCAVLITKDNITLVGDGLPGRPVILENAGGQDTGIEAARANATSPCVSTEAERIQGTTVAGFTVNGFGGNGIRLLCADNWLVAFNSTNNNAEYGIFPAESGNGRVHDNIATGAHDTGIYVGQSHDVRVDHNVATQNVSGFEIENSVNVTMDHNEAFSNTGGILVFILPGLTVLTGANNHVEHNSVHDNNQPNTCLNPGDDVCHVPPGSGILVVAGDSDSIEHNEVLNNETVGIGVVDFCTAFGIPSAICFSLGFDPLPENTRIEFNLVKGNGNNPQFPGLPGEDLFWTGVGSGNCWKDNKADNQFPPELPACK